MITNGVAAAAAVVLRKNMIHHLLKMVAITILFSAGGAHAKKADFTSFWLNSKTHPTTKHEILDENVVLHDIFKNRHTGTDFRKASAVFMIRLFNGIQKTQSVAKAAGQTWEKPDFKLSDTIRSFSASDEKKSNVKQGVVFKIPYLPRNEVLRLAELRFVRRPGDSTSGRRIKLRLDVTKSNAFVRKIVVREKATTQDQYDVYDITRVLRQWINRYHGNVTIRIRLPKPYKRDAETNSRMNRSDSLIVFYLQDHDFFRNMYKSYTAAERSIPETVASRDRRTPRKGRRARGRNKWRKNKYKDGCKRYEYEIDFNTIGWGQWIIHPKRFNARFCYGECPSPLDVKYKPTNHAMLQTLMKIKKPKSAPLPCCVPVKLKPLSMLYFEYDEIVVRHHEEMIADECGCR